MTDTPEITDRNRWLALYVLCTSVLMIVLDVTVVNVALPSIQDDLGFSTSALAWVVNAYLIAFGGLLLLSGRLGDLLGRRNVFLTGMAIFTVASLLCGVAQSQEWLVAARFIQGVGGALTSAVVLGMIVTMFPEPKEQAKALGVYAFVASAGGSIGLLAGGVLTEISWNWIFFINIPIAVGTALYAIRLLEPDRGIGWSKGADIPGAVLITASLMTGVYTIVSPAAEEGWGAPITLALSAVSLVLLVAFIVREMTAAQPIMPLRIFRSRNVTGANLAQALSVSGMFAVFFLGTLYLQGILGYEPLEIGLAFLPTTLVMGLMSVRYSDRLVIRYGARATLIPALVLIGVALAVFSRISVDGSYVEHVLPAMILLGAGAGAAFPALMKLAMSGATPSDAGLASGLVNTSAQVGAALGLAVLATIAASRSDSLIADGEATAQALTSGYKLSFWIGAGLVLAAVAVAVAVIRPEDEAAAEFADGEEQGEDAGLEPAYSEAG